MFIFFSELATDIGSLTILEKQASKSQKTEIILAGQLNQVIYELNKQSLKEILSAPDCVLLESLKMWTHSFTRLTLSITPLTKQITFSVSFFHKHKARQRRCHSTKDTDSRENKAEPHYLTGPRFRATLCRILHRSLTVKMTLVIIAETVLSDGCQRWELLWNSHRLDGGPLLQAESGEDASFVVGVLVKSPGYFKPMITHCPAAMATGIPCIFSETW